MNDNKKFWDFTAAFIYDCGHNLEKKSYEKAASNIVSKINPGDSILELSCGTGMLTREIIERINQPVDYMATDFSSKMLERCFDKVKNIKLEVADATDLRYMDNSYDHVVIANALHIVPDPVKVLQEIRRVLKDDGTLFAPNFLTPSTIRERLMLGLVKPIGYHVFNPFDKETYISFLRDNGFIVTNWELYTEYRTLFYTESKKDMNYSKNKQLIKKR